MIFTFKNTPDGYKVLFDDDVYAEFAVFELRELETAVYTEGRIVWKDDAFDEQWRIPKKQPIPWKPESREWLIGEIVTCLYVGLCRYGAASNSLRGALCRAMPLRCCWN